MPIAIAGIAYTTYAVLCLPVAATAIAVPARRAPHAAQTAARP